MKVSSLIMFRKFLELFGLVALKESVFGVALARLDRRFELDLVALNPGLVLFRFTAEFEVNNRFWIFSTWPKCESWEILLLDSRWIVFLPSDKLLLFRFANISFKIQILPAEDFFSSKFLNQFRFAGQINKN